MADKLIEKLISDGWKTPNTYTNHFGSFPNDSGLYLFLKIENLFTKKSPVIYEIIYIGRAINIKKETMWA